MKRFWRFLKRCLTCQCAHAMVFPLGEVEFHTCLECGRSWTARRDGVGDREDNGL